MALSPNTSQRTHGPVPCACLTELGLWVSRLSTMDRSLSTRRTLVPFAQGSLPAVNVIKLSMKVSKRCCTFGKPKALHTQIEISACHPRFEWGAVVRNHPHEASKNVDFGTLVLHLFVSWHTSNQKLSRSTSFTWSCFVERVGLPSWDTCFVGRKS